MVTAIFALLLYCSALSPTSPRIDHPIVVSISTKQFQFAVPEKKEDPLDDDWFGIEIDLVIRNNSPDPIVLCSADAYLIFPQPYIIRMNRRVAPIWSGDVLCAPLFTELDTRRVEPGHEYSGVVLSRCFTANYSEAPWTYKFAVNSAYSSLPSFSIL